MNVVKRTFGQLPKLFSGLRITSTNIRGKYCQLTSRPLLQSGTVRLCSTYDPYQKVEEPPSPFRPRGFDRIGYKVKIYQGGPLPRPEGEYEDKKVPGTGIDPEKRDAWIPKKALFGQNDYIDILGDGTVHPADLIRSPLWLRNFKGNELQRLIRRFRYTGRYLKEKEPERFHMMEKQLHYHLKKLNHYRPRNDIWSGTGPSRRNRIFNTSRKW